MSQFCFGEELKIVTISSAESGVLKTKTVDLRQDELSVAKEIADRLEATLLPYGAAAGLAAPQIGVSRSVFIFSYDRAPEHLEAVINPTFKPVSEKQVSGWEACFSVILGDVWKLAYVPRYDVVDVTYLNLDGDKVQKRLSGFAAKVFQHEYDHLQGMECICRQDAVVKEFEDKESMMNFLQQVKKEDSKRYNKPNG